VRDTGSGIILICALSACDIVGRFGFKNPSQVMDNINISARIILSTNLIL